jgi:CRP-like cAMP-binding protein
MHSTVEKILILKSAPVFEKVAGEDLAPLARVASEEVYGDGERIFDEGEVGDSLFVVVRGTVAIVHEGETVAALDAGEAFGEMAVLDSAPRSATALARGEVELLRIGSEEFYEILHEQVEIAEGVIRMLTQRLRESTAQLSRDRAERLTAT